MKRLTILGSTGSIGSSTLDVVARHPDRFSVHALAALRSHEKLAAQCERFRPQYAALADAGAATKLEAFVRARGLQTQVLAGPGSLEQVARLPGADTVMAAIVGAAGLPATLAAARAGKAVLLANKEALVVSGALFLAALAEGGGTLLPVDSEHSAIFQSLPRGFTCGRPGEASRAGVRRILLTASGGPFLSRPVSELAAVTPDEACAHPNWVMGRKISVDSATMMNKGLEVIEAFWLFGAPREAIEIVVHPQSVIHSMVEYRDGSVIAQLGAPDMRTPIACALAWPERIDAGVAPVDFAKVGRLDFERADTARFPCVRLAYEALERGGTAPAVLNAANEVAVESFLAGRLGFNGIAAVIENVLAAATVEPLSSLDDAWAADRDARERARGEVSRLAPRHSGIA
jgi:1-deoxy-D-xylulose-5-phosphate reductoisomerase